jgi:hypothetical protein
MKQADFTNLVLKCTSVPAKPGGLWTAVYEFITGAGAVALRFRAEGEWSYAPKRKCGPDGARNLGLPQDVMVPGAPLGALVAKIGGSSADKPDASKQTVFVVGSECVVVLDGKDGKSSGTLFLTMNDEPTQFAGHDGEMQIEIASWDIPVQPKTP